VKLLENPTTCPHGNPIPGVGVPRIDLHALSESAPGDHVRLERVTEQVESDADSLVYLSEHGFVPGVDAEVQSKAPDGTLTLQLHDGTIALGPTLADQLYVAAN
jgi:DtxR family transcriptional regulator, Mn-dependent transcriptional regulator